MFPRLEKYGCRAVHIGGGEPMLKPGALADVLSAAQAERVAIEYVETNSSWYTDESSTLKLLTDLRRYGLKTLLISISPFHNESIPYEKVLGVMNAANETGIGIFPWISAFMEHLANFDIKKTHSLDEYKAMFGNDYLLGVIRQYWVHLGGRALGTYRPHLGRYTADHIIEKEKGNCLRELSDTSHFHMDLYSRYIPGLCSGLAIEIDDLGKPLSTSRYPLLSVLAASGVRGLFLIAKERFGYRASRSDYINKCDLCTEIRTHIFLNAPDSFRELHPHGFYKELCKKSGN